MNLKIALLPGDGIGPEVVDAAVSLMKVAAEKFHVSFRFNEQLVGGSSFDKRNTTILER
jgi:3-isopropylmalate dehydrogenase